MIQKQHVEYEIYFVMFYMILTCQYKGPTVTQCFSEPHYQLPGLHLHSMTSSSHKGSCQVSRTLGSNSCNHSVCGEETSSSVAAGKLQTSSVLTTNKKYTPDKRFFAQTLILWYFCLKNLKFLLHRLALKLDFFFFLHLNATLSNLDIFVIQNSVCSCVFVFEQNKPVVDELIRVHATLKRTETNMGN